MNAMRKRIKIFGPHSQQGAALVIAIMILLILTVLGIYAITTSTLETKIAGSERELKTAFYAADAGQPIGINVIKAIIQYVPTSPSALPAPWDAIVQDGLDGFITNNEIFTDIRNTTDTPTNQPDVIVNRTDLGLTAAVPIGVTIDIDRITSYQLSGGATEYGSGYEGIGQGGGGDVGVIYALDSLGRYTFSNTASELEAGYRYVIGVAGGE